MSTPNRVPLDFAITGSAGPTLGARDPEGNDALETLASDGVNQVRIPAMRHRELEGISPGSGPLPQTVQDVQDQLDWAQRVTERTGRRMTVAVNPGDLTAYEPGTHNGRWFEYVVERFKDHPALGVWKFYDEPNNPYNPYDKMLRVRKGLRRAHAYVHEKDGKHYTWVTQAPKPRDRITERYLATFMDACDIHAVDVYPVSDPPGKHSDLPNKLPSCVGDYADRFANVARREIEAGRTRFTWMVLQGAGWSGVLPRDENRRALGPVLMQPPEFMFRYMVFQSIIHGAEGIVVFGMPVGLYPDMKPYGWDWGYWRNTVLPTLRELRSPGLAAALAAWQPETAQLHKLGDRDVRIDSLVVKAPSGERFLLATRSEYKRYEPREAEVEIPVDGTSVRHTFAPHEVLVRALDR